MTTSTSVFLRRFPWTRFSSFVARFSSFVAPPIIIVGGIVACSESKAVPKQLLGSYVRSEPSMIPGYTRAIASLDVTPTGIATRSPSAAVKSRVTESSATSSATSVLFKSVSCTESMCKFVGDDGRCDGTFTRDEVGDLSVTASGLCTLVLDGKWLGAKSGANAVPTGPALH